MFRHLFSIGLIVHGLAFSIPCWASVDSKEIAEVDPILVGESSPETDRTLARFAGPFTSLERRLFDDAADGKWDDFTLLDAALIASGADREETLHHYEKRLDAILADLRPRIDSRWPVEKQAEQIFDYLHREILKGGYRLEGTDLRTVFDRGAFNCVSASVLYNALADGLGLRCCGLEMPGHAMSRVFLTHGILDIETTCPRWFQLQREALGSDRSEELSKTQGFEARRDRSKIREVTPIQLTAMIYYNRGVDDLTEKRFAQAAAVNAKALLLDPKNATARGNFLATLNNWSIALGSAGKYGEAVDLIRAGLVFDRKYSAFRQNLVHLHHEWSEQYCRQGKFEEALALLKKASEEFPQSERLRPAKWAVYRSWARSLLDRDRFDETFVLFEEARQAEGESEELRTWERTVIGEAGRKLFAQGRQEEAGRLYSRLIEFQPGIPVLQETSGE